VNTISIHVTVNGEARDVDVPPGSSLLSLLRARGEILHPVQQAFLDEDAMQCGACTSGMVISAVARLEQSPHPDENEIRKALAPHLCRCGVYSRAIRAVKRAAR
jgi:aerobic-type carbon monoxide dehydrogenase small subunit (CoxS/CutS family)